MSQISLVILLGPPGSGKGTQVDKLIALPNSSAGKLVMGDAFRKLISSDGLSEEMSTIKQVIQSGGLVSDEHVFALFETELAELAKSLPSRIFLDGFPRSKEQASFLIRTLDKACFSLEKVFLFEISTNDIEKRIIHRLVCDSCNSVFSALEGYSSNEVCSVCQKGTLYQRKDDTSEIVRKRYALFQQEAQGVVEVLSQAGLEIEKIDAAQPQETVFDILAESLN